MKTNERGCPFFASVVIAVVIALLAPPLGRGAAAVLVERSFDQILQGDDPGELFTFDLPFDLAVPATARFDGFFENLDSSATGVRIEYWWPRADGTGTDGFRNPPFTVLPASARLPINFEESIGFTPDTLFFHVEGGGPIDHFRFAGNLAVDQVPEPTAAMMLVFVAPTLSGRRLCRKRNSNPTARKDRRILPAVRIQAQGDSGC